MAESRRLDSTCRAPVVHLLDSFRLDVGERELVLPVHAQRVLAYLAVTRSTGLLQRRTALAGQLWSDAPHPRAQASLRTAIWRIRQADGRLVYASRERVSLGAAVEIDVENCVAQARRLLADDSPLQPHDSATTGLVADLLPGWEEDWLVVERERIRQIRIHALVALSRRLCELRSYIPALDAAYTAITAEPLNESAHGALVEIHLAEGDVVQARRQVERYARLLWAEMRLTPSESLLRRVVRPPVSEPEPPAQRGVSGGSVP